MAAANEDGQKIARLTPLADAMAALEKLAKPAAPRDIRIAEAAGRVLAKDVTAAARPPRPLALADGFAVKAEELQDAGGYAPVRLAGIPPRVETGDEMPAGTDAVAPLDLIILRGGGAEAVGAVTAGEGVLPAGGETDPAQPLRKAGERLRAIDIAVLAAAEIARVTARVPRFSIVAAREDLRLLPAAQMIARDCATQGGEPLMRNGVALEDALRATDADALIIIGGSGTGGRDASVKALARAGRVVVHGIGITPGDSAAIGEVTGRPVLVVPGRLDAALAVWLTLGRSLLAALAGGRDDARTFPAALARKVTSTVGLAEFVPVRLDGDQATPLASKFLPFKALARADGWLLVPAQSEGFAAGAQVALREWP